MSIDIRIDSYDISDMDERLDRAFDIRNGWGTEAVSDDNIMLTDNLGRFPQGSVHAVMQTQQAQIEDQQALILAQQDKFDTMVKHIKKLESTVFEITDALDSVGKNFFAIGMKQNSKANAEVK
jgi:septal ring factor EnvC (AmiA/AmiB activator)